MVSSGVLFQRVFARMLLAILFGPLVCLGAVEPEEIEGTMPEDFLPELKPILAHALQRAPEVIARDFERLANEARILEVNAARLPRLGGNFSYASTETATSSDTSSRTRDNGFFYNFGLSQELFHWGALKNQTTAARLNLLVAERSVALVYRELSVTLRKAFLALVVEKAFLRERRESLQLLGDDVHVMTVRQQQGSVSAAAVEGERLREREAQLSVNRAEAAFADNRSRFARLAGLPEAALPEDAIPDEIPRPSYSEPRVAAMTAMLLRDNAKSTLEYEIYDMRLREAMLRQKIESVRLLPKFGATASYSLENNTNVNGNLVEQRAVARQTIGIGGSWNIFDGLATRGAKRGALIARRSIEHQMATTMQQLLQNAQHLERSLKLDAEQLDLADIHRGMAGMVHDQAKEEVEHGNIPRVEIARALIRIRQADARRLESRAAYLTRWSEFVALTAMDPVLNNLPARYVR